MYDDDAAFASHVRTIRSAAIFIDESGKVFDRHNDENWWLATDARHYGHIVFFLAQELTQIPPTMRNQCPAAYIFRQNDPAQAKKLAARYGCPELASIGPSLEKGEFIIVRPFEPAKLGIIDFPSGTVKIKKSLTESNGV